MSNPNPLRENLNRGGRPKGVRNRRTVSAEASARAVVAGMAPETVARMTPLDVLLTVMAAKMAAGDLMAAVSVASLAAPYCHGRVSPNAPDTALPAELMPDPPAQPDEPGPPGGIIE